MEGIVGVAAVAGGGETGSGDDDEAGPFGPEHLEGRDVAEPTPMQAFGILIFLVEWATTSWVTTT